MLDTDIASYIIKKRSPEIEVKLALIPPSQVCISVVTRAELLYGLKRLPLQIVCILRRGSSCGSFARCRGMWKRRTTTPTFATS